MNALNINYGKVLVLIFIGVTFYWLMLPGAQEDVVIKEASKSHPHHDHHEIIDKKIEDKNTIKEKINVQENVFSRSKEQYEASIAEKDNTIKLLKQRLSSATDVDNESKKQLENEIKKISEKSDETESKYKELNKKYLKLKEETSSSKTTSGTLVPFKGLKLIHMDLKGAPPKIEYLLEMMIKMKEYGATGLLMEYEDMFPWSGELSVLACKNAYSKDDLKRIFEKADELQLEIIPLIQTFGHLEFVLKHKEFADLRAVNQVTTSICPLNQKSVPFVKKLVEQVVKMHPKMKWMHLGGDEVWNIKSCDRCQEGNFTDTDLYHRHMLPVIEYVKTLNKNLSPIIWDDMMRSWTVKDLKKMAEHVTPMVWGYVADLSTYGKFPADMWDRYMEVFPKIFFASSFKGALKPWSNFVPVKQHLSNHLSWLKIYKKFLDKSKAVEGIALTGWSRFDHYGPLCELLPSGIPSMSLCLAVLNLGGFTDDVHDKTSQLLGFKKAFKIKINNFKNYEPEIGTFPGHELYELVGALEQATGWNDWSNVRLRGWTRPFHIKRGHLSFFQMNTTRNGLEESLSRIKKVKGTVNTVLDKYFFKDTVDEWVSDKIEYLEEKVDKTLQNVKNILNKNF